MSWLIAFVSLLFTGGTRAEVSRARVDEHEVNEQIEHFLRRIEHPAGRALAPVEPGR